MQFIKDSDGILAIPSEEEYQICKTEGGRIDLDKLTDLIDREELMEFLCGNDQFKRNAFKNKTKYELLRVL